MLNFQVNISKENETLLKEAVKEINILNEHLYDIKKMIAPLLGYKIVENKEDLK